jgi:hypothetical protein
MLTAVSLSLLFMPFHALWNELRHANEPNAPE